MSQRRRSSKKPDYFFVVMTFTLGLWFVVFTVVVVTRLVGPIELPQPREVAAPTAPNPFGGGQFASPSTDTPSSIAVTVQDYTQVVFGLPTDPIGRNPVDGNPVDADPVDTVFRAEASNTENSRNTENSSTSNLQTAISNPAVPSSVADTELEASAADVNTSSENVTSNTPSRDTSTSVQVNIPETMLPVATETLSSMLTNTPEISAQLEQPGQQDVVTGPLELFPESSSDLTTNLTSNLTDVSSQQDVNTAQASNTTASQSNPPFAPTTTNVGQRTSGDIRIDENTGRDATADRALTNRTLTAPEDGATVVTPDEQLEQLDGAERSLVDSFVAASQVPAEQAINVLPLATSADAPEAPVEPALELTPALDTTETVQTPVQEATLPGDARATTTSYIDGRALTNPASSTPVARALVTSTEDPQNAVTTASTEVTLAQSENAVRVLPPPLLPTELASDSLNTSADLPPAPGVTVTATGAATTSAETVIITFISNPVGAEVITEAGVLGTTPLALELPVGSDLSYTLAVPETSLGNNFRRFSSVLQATEDSTVSIWLDRIAGPPRPVEGFGTTRFVGTPAASPEAVKQLRETLQSMLTRSRAEYQNALEDVQLGALEAEIDALENELARLDALAGDNH